MAQEHEHVLVHVQAQAWLHRLVWLLCIAVYLFVFVGGVVDGRSDVLAMLHAGGLSIATAVLGRLALGLLSRAGQPNAEQPSAGQDRTLGSLVDLVSSPKVVEPQGEPDTL
jgi:hypothetical protein